MIRGVIRIAATRSEGRKGEIHYVHSEKSEEESSLCVLLLDSNKENSATFRRERVQYGNAAKGRTVVRQYCVGPSFDVLCTCGFDINA